MALVHHVIDGIPREVDVPDAHVEILADAGWTEGPWPGEHDDLGRPVADPTPEPDTPEQEE